MKKLLIVACQKLIDGMLFPFENDGQIGCGFIPGTNPYHAGRRPSDQAKVIKISIKGHDNKIMSSGKLPYLKIRCIKESYILYMNRAGKNIPHRLQEPEGDVLIKKQFQEATLVLCSLSAAKARHALIDNSVSSGKSWII
jgi:hypothetical protein